MKARLIAFSITAALLAGGWLIYQRDLARELERVSTGSRIADTRCGPIEFAAMGSGPAVLLVHGAGGGFDQLLDLAEQLASVGFRAIAMSRFGYLGTPLPADASPEAQADAHACLLDALGVERAAIAASLPRYELERISAPTLVMSVADDLYGTYESARYTAAHIPGARFIGYASGGHLWVGHHGEIMAELIAFLGKPAAPLAGLSS